MKKVNCKTISKTQTVVTTTRVNVFLNNKQVVKNGNKCFSNLFKNYRILKSNVVVKKLEIAKSDNNLIGKFKEIFGKNYEFKNHKVFDKQFSLKQVEIKKKTSG